jgi:polyvinyl alcohol dehydrogenase (cytochrome)
VRARLLVAALAVGGLALPVARAVGPVPSPFPGCGPVNVAGGEWRTYGHDLANSRHQDREKQIGPATVGQLTVAWKYQAEGAVFNNTPIVADGCLYLAAADGTVSAHDADTGERRWSTTLATDPPGFGGGVVATPAVDDARVYVIVNQEGSPYLQALDRTTGAPVWKLVLDGQAQAMSNSSPVLFDGMVFAGFSGDAGPGESERGGYVIADAATGGVNAKHYVIDDARFGEGYAGAGVWSTPAIDVESGYAYVGTSNPHSPELEHERANSVLKIDVDLDRPDTFGRIVDHYKGKPDTYVPGLSEQPVCDAAPDVYYVDRFSATCLAIDLDFGASPTLFTAGGTLLVGDLQKAGVFHAVDPATMDRVWETVVGVPCLACNAASPASVDGAVYTAAGPPGQLFRLDGATGAPRWAGSLTGPTTYNPVTVANHVVYSVDSGGFLNGFVAESGLHLLKRNLALDTGESMATASSSSGVAVARNTLYVAAGAWVLAYRLGPGGLQLPAPPPPPGGGGTGGGATIIAGPGAVATTYANPTITVPRGTKVNFSNLDVPQHDVVSKTAGLFRSALVGTGRTTPVVGVDVLDAGSYAFFCSLHPNMTGTLTVT